MSRQCKTKASKGHSRAQGDKGRHMVTRGGTKEYLGNCTEENVVDEIFGSVSEFARQVEQHGDEFTYREQIIVKYNKKTDVHSFFLSGLKKDEKNP